LTSSPVRTASTEDDDWLAPVGQWEIPLMKKRLLILMLAAIAGGTVGCDDSATGPGAGDSFTELGVNADMELQVVGDAELAEVLIDDMSLVMRTPTDGPPFGDGRRCLRDARQLLRDGNDDAARNQARECRLNLVRAMLERRGEGAIEELFGRVESLVERVGEAGDEFARLAELEAKLRGLLEEAYTLRDGGDLVGAGERLVLALQIADRMRHRHPDFDRDPEAVARLAMALSGEAIRLAERLIPEPTLKQEAFLFRAVELRRRAQFSFENGWYRRAVGQAHRAAQLSLVAVLNGERPTVEDAQQLLGIADEMIVGAEEAIGDSPTDAQQRILQHAIRLRDRGAEAINTWQWRGVGLLWRSAITSAVLIP
jgi:HEPN domain-containing protein